jgi:superfamily II DNA or RNA helicase
MRWRACVPAICRVITNFNVLTEGFDAPGVRTGLIARPTFSPNRYMQMVGRGLRGPLNGGTGHCTVLDVIDNLLRWHHSQAFVAFRSYWS